VTEVLAFLALFDCHPTYTLVPDPALVRVAEQRGPVVRLRSADPAVLVHELWHVCQEQALGLAETQEESARREAEARRVELMWRQQ